MNQAFHFAHVFRRQRIGIDFKRRERDDVHVPLVHRFARFVRADHVSVVVIPHDFVKRRAARFRPQRRPLDDFIEVDAVLHRFQNVRTQPRRFHVVVRIGKRAHVERRTHLRKPSEPRFDRGRDVVEALARLPKKAVVFLLDAARRNVAILVSADKIHIELPAALDLPPHLAPFFKIGVKLRDEFLFPPRLRSAPPFV